MAFIRASQGGGGGGGGSVVGIDSHFDNQIVSSTTATITGLSSYSKVIIILSCSLQSGKDINYMKDYCYMNGYSPIMESGQYKNSSSSSHLVRTYVRDNTFGDSLTITGKWNGYQVLGVS